MAANSHTCGNCSKPVDASDITCPHCGALLAAYASPAGSVTTAPEYSTPSYAAPPVVTEIIQTETAPEPLFDTHLTVEELAEAANLDHPVELLLAGVEIPHEQPKADTIPEPEPDAPTDPWPIAESAPLTVDPDPPIERTPEPDRVGETEAYLRKLHKKAGYIAATGSLSSPVTTRRPTPADRMANRAARESAQRHRQPVTPLRGPLIGPALKIAVAVAWVIALGTAMTGHASVPLFMLTIVLTMWLKMQTGSGRP